jgi:hypothetical protein
MITLHLAHVLGVKPRLEELGCKEIQFVRQEEEPVQRIRVDGLQKEAAAGFVASGILRHRYRTVSSRLTVRDELIWPEEVELEQEDLTRFWLTADGYALFWFRGTKITSDYSYHRWTVARCLSDHAKDPTQEVVVPAAYELPCLRTRFPSDIWVQGFRRRGNIRRGTIGGAFMETDPLYPEFVIIDNYVGITVPVTGSNEKLKVLTGGRLQFMSWQAEEVEQGSERKVILESIREVLTEISPCLTKPGPP